MLYSEHLLIANNIPKNKWNHGHTFREEIYTNFFCGHFAGINLSEFRFTKDFASINFRKLSLTKDFSGIDFHESALFKDFAGVNLEFVLRNIFFQGLSLWF